MVEGGEGQNAVHQQFFKNYMESKKVSKQHKNNIIKRDVPFFLDSN